MLVWAAQDLRFVTVLRVTSGSDAPYVLSLCCSPAVQPEGTNCASTTSAPFLSLIPQHYLDEIEESAAVEMLSQLRAEQLNLPSYDLQSTYVGPSPASKVNTGTRFKPALQQ